MKNAIKGQIKGQIQILDQVVNRKFCIIKPPHNNWKAGVASEQ